MAIAIITAGGTGVRFGNSVPKQFITVNDIPIIVYTMQNVQNSGCYQEMYIVCADGWKDFIFSYSQQYGISIFKDTISGADSRFKSVSNGLSKLIEIYDGNEIVSIFDANRPLTPQFICEDGIKAIEEADCVIPLEPCFDSMYIANTDSKTVETTAERSILFKGQSPETCRLGLAHKLHQKAENEGITGLTTTALMLRYGKRVVYTKGVSNNFKITTVEDLAIFKALIN